MGRCQAFAPRSSPDPIFFLSTEHAAGKWLGLVSADFPRTPPVHPPGKKLRWTFIKISPHRPATTFLRSTPSDPTAQPKCPRELRRSASPARYVIPNSCSLFCVEGNALTRGTVRHEVSHPPISYNLEFRNPARCSTMTTALDCIRTRFWDFDKLPLLDEIFRLGLEEQGLG